MHLHIPHIHAISIPIVTPFWRHEVRTKAEVLMEVNAAPFLIVKTLEKWLSTVLNLTATVFGAVLTVVCVLIRSEVNKYLCTYAFLYRHTQAPLLTWYDLHITGHSRWTPHWQVWRWCMLCS